MAEISDELLTFIVQKAGTIHHGAIVIDINEDKPGVVNVEVVQKERFRTSEKIDVAPPRARKGLTAEDSVEKMRRG